MQASIHQIGDRNEPAAGSALLDDGRVVTFGPEAWVGNGLRHLRIGQRVSVVLAEDEVTVSRLWIAGIGDGERIL